MLCLAVDVKGYGAQDGRQQVETQRVLVTALEAASCAALVDTVQWLRQPTGDGQLILNGRTADDPRIVDDFVAKLASELRDHNERTTSERWIRLRLAMHHGVVTPAENGYAGPAVVLVGRLVDCAAAKAALVGAAQLVHIISESLYEDMVRGRITTLRPADFRPADVSEKEFHGVGWLRVLGAEPTGETVRPTSSPPTNGGHSAGDQFAWNIYGDIHSGTTILGPAR